MVMMMIMVVVLQMAADEFITMAIEAFQIMDATKWHIVPVIELE